MQWDVLVTHTATGVNVETIVLRSQNKKSTYCMIPFK